MKAQMNANDVFENGIKLPYVYFRTISEVFIGKKDDATWDLEKLKEYNGLHEIRFFDENDEYRIYMYDGKLYGIHTYDTGSEDTSLIKRKYKIENRKKFGKTVNICYYLDSDDEGQNYIAYSRLCGWSDN